MSNTLYTERLARIRKAVALEPVDKVPVAPCANAYFARAQGVLTKDHIRDFELACTTNIKSLEEMGGVDATQNEIFSPFLLSGQWMSKIAVPGRELGDNELWQVVEKENMKQEEYREIIDNGFAPFYEKFLVERCGDPENELKEFYAYSPIAKQRFIEAGIPCICDFLMITPFEFFCGGRSLEAFFMDDLMDEPDLVEAAFKRVMEYTIPKYRAMMEQLKPIGVWIGGWRTAPDMLSPAIWDRFVWPYFKAYADLCLEHGVIPIFHLDSCWNNALERFREMPAKRCILALDSKTDIRRARKALDGHMCIMGDVPAELLAFGTPEQVKAYVTSVIDDIGPIGYIAASGCDIPIDAKKENVRAMCDAASGYLRDRAK